ncbi:hypothetical protein L873DRAFT_272314 [Choiromyces venosus 120613-1]|uniref:Ubiquitin-like protease family profile domain-containing protein n=1 Tax=Choiromyces venosus 120613-1 TaxID=1336337 RepID=A0A3N4K3N4_9PEZI|nr:hypothetical protein L873DRAFT_272314 [Choiromyces venosus 120613-1]
MSSSETHWTTDSVLDSWFSILFSFASLQDKQSCKVAFLSSIISSIPSIDNNTITNLISCAFNDFYCFNYWHFLEFLYFPLNVNENHWFLVRVGIHTKTIEIFDSTGISLEVQIQKKIIFFLKNLQQASWEAAQRKNLVSPDAKPSLIQKWTLKQPKDKHPKQGKKSLDCAYFVMQTAYLLLRGEELKYGQKDMLDIKREMIGILLANMELVT